MMDQVTKANSRDIRRPVTSPWTDDAARWDAVAARDANADGAFVYAVKTTGVYCMASCPARRPARANVIFFASGTEAADAGFRACLRCRPDGERQAQVREAMIAACRKLDDASEELSLDVLAADCGMSRSHFQRMFKAIIGMTPAAFAAQRRAMRAQALLVNARTTTDAAYEAGFNSASRFYATAAPQLGMAPRTWRKGGAGETIRFAIGTSSLGEVLVGATERGVCTIAIGDDAAGLLRIFQDQFSRAVLIGDDPTFANTLASAIALIEEPASPVALPLDIAGTVFQHKVWAALRAIPAGMTLSYAELARRIGAPDSVRAVARACASNGVAVAIPCHRIVRSNGDLSGYRWGVARKEALLARERNARPR